MALSRWLTGAALLATVMTGAGQAQDALPAGDWRTINRDLAATRYSPLNDINRSNVASLQQAWTYPLRAFNTAVPLVVDGVMYMPAQNRVLALDAATGTEIWVHEVTPPADQAQGMGGGGFSSRGVGYWPGQRGMAPRILVMRGNKLIALDAATGEPVTSFGTNGEVEVGVAYGGTPTINGNVAVIGAASLENPQGAAGNPRAFDVVTGAKLWEFDTTPDPGHPGSETWGAGSSAGRGGTNMWGFAATVDAASNTVYLPIAGPAHNYYGGDRPGNNLYGNSIVAVDMRTGAYKWHFQTVHHDLWDIDMSHAGPLIPVRGPDGRHQALANIGKSSLFFLIDAQDGEPVLPVAEKPVPQGNVPGEWYSPTQPIPQATPPLSRVSMTYADIVSAEDTNAAHSAACHAMWDRAGGYLNFGIYTPFNFRAAGAPAQSTIQLPGGTGGVNWGGPAADPTTGIVYVNAQDTSLVGWVERVEGDRPYSFDATSSPAYDRASVDGKGPFFSFSAPLSGEYDANNRPVGVTAPCYKPPWSRLTAVNANTGEILWAVPLGTFDTPEGPRAWGNSGSAGPTVTAGGLVFVGATNDRRFRAFDAATGEQLWETALNGNANANPMTYRGKDGKQYVAINASGVIMVYSLDQ
ncbi:outer membrane protein assembly factor BamB family protein [Alteraurantiacibacter buctensis]|uniref:PQQ-binding-like beta-propeller repeat protein n=1 Tax=Alteraurantiacibacter buctensis TaxID=1503981 RepID=A0A844YY92_9SPHN|nr:PQQ-binding-like beta-propeller repeat protein [Alteraurantiacibacter buctensis]MXO71996.1 PQQ-binding-like beta-propeller repeat protein [Alteraurantiacibacter buctensis]